MATANIDIDAYLKEHHCTIDELVCAARDHLRPGESDCELTNALMHYKPGKWIPPIVRTLVQEYIEEELLH